MRAKTWFLSSVRAAPTNPLMVRRMVGFSGSRKRISHSSRSLRLSPLLEGEENAESTGI